jgi:hypothetical protein
MQRWSSREGNKSWPVKDLVRLEASGSRSFAKSREGGRESVSLAVLLRSLRAAWIRLIGGLPFGLVLAVRSVASFTPLGAPNHPMVCNPGRGIGSTLWSPED